MTMRTLVALLLAALFLPALGPARAAEDGERRYVGEPIDLSLRDADLVETLRTFAEIGGFNMVLQPGVSGKVTVELRKVPWDLALEQILKINNLGMEVRGGQFHVNSRAEIAERREQQQTAGIVSLTLRHADAAVVAGALSRAEAGVLSATGSIEARPGNKLHVRDAGGRLVDVGRILARVDLPGAEDETPEALEARCLAVWRELRGE